MYKLLFGDRDPVAEPGTATGTPGDWWTVWANSPDVLEHAVRRLRPLRQPRAQDLTGAARAGPDPGRLARRQPVRVLAALQVAAGPSASPRRRSRRSRHWQVSDVFEPSSSGRCSPTPTASCWRTAASPTACSTVLHEHLDDEAILDFTYITMTYAMHAVMSVALRTRVRRARRPDRRGRGARGLRGGQPRPPDQRARRRRDRVTTTSSGPLDGRPRPRARQLHRRPVRRPAARRLRRRRHQGRGARRRRPDAALGHHPRRRQPVVADDRAATSGRSSLDLRSEPAARVVRRPGRSVRRRARELPARAASTDGASTTTTLAAHATPA